MSVDADLSVLQVNTSDRGGGAEAVAFDLHEASGPSSGFGSGGWAPAFAAAWSGRTTPRRRHQRFVLWRGAGLGNAKTRTDCANSIGDPGVITDLARGHEDFRFPASHTLFAMAASAKVVHLHNLHGGYFDLRILPGLSRLRPTVITIHDEWTFTGHCASTLGCEERSARRCGSCPHLDVYPRLRRDGTAFNLSRKQDIGRSHVFTWSLQLDGYSTGHESQSCKVPR